MKKPVSKARKKPIRRKSSQTIVPVFLLIVALSITILFLGQKQTFTPNAQTVPSPACLGSCPGASGTTAPAVQTGTQPSAMVSSGTTTNQATSAALTTNATGAAAPCMTTAQITQSHEHQRGLLSDIGNFFLALILEFFKILLQLLLGGGLNIPSSPVVSPSIAVTSPTTPPAPAAPCPQASPAAIAAAPSTSPAPSNAIAPQGQAANGTQTGTTGQAASGQTEPTLPIDSPGGTSNWAGYVFDVNSDTSNNVLSATWNVSSVDCSLGDGDIAPWIGFGGLSQSDPNIAQVGYHMQCQGGKTTYQPWTEAFPDAPVNLNYAINKDDQINGSITWQGNATFATQMSDAKAGWNVSTPMSFQNNTPPKTAEMAFEAQFNGGLGVCKFDPAITFTNDTYMGQPISKAAGLKHLELINGNSQKTVVSGLDAGNAMFTIAWLAF